MIEAAGDGMDLSSLETYGRKLVNHDPFSNVLFALQIDGNVDDNEVMQERIRSLHAARIPIILSSLQHSAVEFNEETSENVLEWMEFCWETGLGYLASTCVVIHGMRLATLPIRWTGRHSPLGGMQ